MLKDDRPLVEKVNDWAYHHNHESDVVGLYRLLHLPYHSRLQETAMTNYLALHRMIDYVESLPDDTPFDYLDPWKCLYGCYRKHLWETGMLKADTTSGMDMAHRVFDLDSIRHSDLYGGLVDRDPDTFRIKDRSEALDRLRICAKARALVAQWEAEDLWQTAKASSKKYTVNFTFEGISA